MRFNASPLLCPHVMSLASSGSKNGVTSSPLAIAAVDSQIGQSREIEYVQRAR